MPHIFISHSQLDIDIMKFFLECFEGTGIKPLLYEYEQQGAKPAERIMGLIRQAEAVFITLGPNVASLPHTRTWVAWEAGVAATCDKEIWVFEPVSKEFQEVPVPYLRHYVPYALEANWGQYVNGAVCAYTQSRGIRIGKGFQLGGKVHVELTAINIQCPSEKCGVEFSAHTTLHDFPCPACRQWMRVNS